MGQLAKQGIISLVVASVGWLTAIPVLANEPLSSTYLPTLSVAIDGQGVDRSVVLHAHRDNPTQDDLYLCGHGRCDFDDNRHSDEPAWTYTVELLKNKAPSEAGTDAAALFDWYSKQTDDVVVSFAVTDALRQASFVKTPRKRDYTLQLMSADNTVELVTVDAGEYNPIPTEFSLSNFTFAVDSFRTHVVEIGTVVVTILIIYYGIKIVTI